MYKTINNGATWSALPVIDANSYIEQLAVMPDGTLYAGTLNYTTTPISGAVYKTTDGINWIPMTGLDGSYITSMAVDENFVLYVGTVSAIYQLNSV